MNRHDMLVSDLNFEIQYLRQRLAEVEFERDEYRRKYNETLDGGIQHGHRMMLRMLEIRLERASTP